MLVVTTAVMFVLVVFENTMNGQIHAQHQEKDGAYMPKPFLERSHFLCQIADADSTVAHQPSDQHDRQACAQAEDDRHDPVPRVWQGKRDINHRQKIHQSMRAKRNRKENTEDERPEPTLLAIRLFEPFADAMIMLVVMVTAKEQHDTANQHKARQDRFAPMTQHMLDTFRLCAHEERDAQ